MNTESGIQQAILAYLAYEENKGRVWAIRNNTFSGHIQRANGSRGYVKNSKEGSPDVLLCAAGRFVGVEIKTEKGKQNPAQKACQQAVEKAGGTYLLVRSVDELQRELGRLMG